MIKTDPENALFHYMLGLEYLKAEHSGKAVEPLRESIRIKPDYSAAYRELGKALEKEEQTSEAIEIYEKGIDVAEEQGDLQTAKEMRVFVKRLHKK
ncbi:MAG: hypothetical protein GWN00_14995 [Aliifodinibius sp.]|nr:hypothetical protein [Fodinibius sp.]NIV12398.1 hypothetical protein [Fodinibius sp.]NIY26061.1 hypothetical protein [Fodinibius sp.]